MQRPIPAVVLWALASCVSSAPAPVVDVDLPVAFDATAGDERASQYTSPAPLIPSQRQRATTPRRDQLKLEVLWVPAMWVEIQGDGDGGALEPDVQPGQGIGGRVGFQSGEQGVGVLYMHTEHDEDRRGLSARTDSVYLDFQARQQLHQSGSTRGYVSAAAGLGAANVTFSDSFYDDSLGAAAELRAELELEIGANVAVEFGGGGFFWGYPGDTLGYGAFLTLGGKVMF